MTNVVVVESPAKAKTINKYLGSEYRVVASYGHVRDLPAKDGSVRPDDDFAMDWELQPKAEKHIRALTEALKGADRLFLATDPDREGEAISWHVLQVLDERRALDGLDVKRVVFNQVTREAVLDAFRSPRELDRELVEAYLARRALDYLVGFTLSPVLWRKLPGSRSAGRVQSVALRLICEREADIEDFVSREYWSVSGVFGTAGGASVVAQLTHLDGRKLDKMALADEAAAGAAVESVQSRTYSVGRVTRKETRRHPAPPFTTSTLQQEASRKLRMKARRTMQVAQRLYEGVAVGGETVGLITYLRTDGVQMADEAIAACRRLIERELGAAYRPPAPRAYKTKAKNAQEAHEAIRPTDVFRRPADVAGDLDADQRRLYELIWKRTVASQMESARLDQVAADLTSTDGLVSLRATGSAVSFDGFFRLYRESRDDAEDEDADRMLPPIKEGEPLSLTEVKTEQHFTQPPPRFSEASLVKRLEELGIGRPSTYASILTVLQDRNYVRLEGRRFVPEDRGRLVTAFLTGFFRRYVEYDFTAELEEKLDDISGGRIDRATVLREFWQTFSKAVDETRELGVKEVLDALDALLGPHFFRADEAGADPRVCSACADGRLGLRLGRFGAFIGCSNYPACRFTRPLQVGNDEASERASAVREPRLLGSDPETGLPVSLRMGPYGAYVQLGEAEKEDRKRKAAKPRRASVPEGMDAGDLDLERALALLSLPREVGHHPETGDAITAGLGRFGPYIRYQGNYLSLKDDDVLSIGLNRAVTLIAEAPKKVPGRDLGSHPKDGKTVTVRHGRFGPYVQHGSQRVRLPKTSSADTVTLAEALDLLARNSAGAAKGRGRSGGRANGKAPSSPGTKRRNARPATSAGRKAKP